MYLFTMYRLLFVIFSVTVLTLAAGVARSAPAGPVNVLVAYDRTEPFVAVDPHAPSTVVVVANTNYDAPRNGTYPAGYFTSRDGGATFGAGDAPVFAPYTTQADPAVSIDASGTVFFSYLAEAPSFCSSQGGAQVLLATSIDHGRSFRRPTVVDTAPSDDKPFSAVEDVPGQRFAHVFVTWARPLAHVEQIWLARSTNGGATFGKPIKLYTSRDANYGSLPVVGPHGHIYVVWSSFPASSYTQVGHAQILMRASSDYGKRFGTVTRVTRSFPSVPINAAPGDLRSEPGPWMLATPDGSLAVAWAQVSHSLGGPVEADVLVSRSTNRGVTWSAPARVNDVLRGDRFMPVLTAMPDGSVGVAFYDRRNGGNDLEVYAARVSFRHGFHRSVNLRVTHGTAPISDIYDDKPGASSCFYPGRFFGDYIGAAAMSSNRMAVVWADTQLHVYARTDIWFARVTLPPAR
jgi:hypothetical protein